MGHELSHVEQRVSDVADYKKIFAKIGKFGAYHRDHLLRNAAFTLAIQEFNDATIGPDGRPIGLANLTSAIIVQKTKPYADGRIILLQLRDQAREDIAGIDDRVRDADTPAKMTDVVLNASGSEAATLRTRMSGVWAGAVTGQFGYKTIAGYEDHLTTQKLLGDANLQTLSTNSGADVKKMLRKIIVAAGIVPEDP